MSDNVKIHRKSALRHHLGNLAGKLGFNFLHMYYGEKDLNEPIPNIQAPINVEISCANAEDLEQIKRLISPGQVRMIQSYTDFGDTCLVAKCDGEIAGYSWWNRSEIRYGAYTLVRLPENMGYTFGSFVFPEFRGKKIFQCLTCAVYSSLKAQGCEFCCNLVDQANGPSVGARRNLGATFQPVRILKLPLIRPRIIGRGFVMGRAKQT